MVHCIAYDENGSEACFEANGTVKTCEQLIVIVHIYICTYVPTIISVVPGKNMIS